jgi:hypothetical protein
VHKDLKFGALEKPFKHTRLSTDPFDSGPQFMLEMWQIATADITEFDSLQVAPEPLVRIQFRGIGGEVLQLHPLRRPMGQKILDQMTAVNRCPIPEDQQAPGHLVAFGLRGSAFPMRPGARWLTAERGFHRALDHVDALSIHVLDNRLITPA